MKTGEKMTEAEKRKIIELRNTGLSYSEISSKLKLSRNTVASFCRRSKCSERNETDNAHCLICRAMLEQTPKKRKKKFCCKSCKNKWWNAHRDELKSNRIVTKRCLSCGSEFKTYESKDRKYCSRRCYLGHRSGEDGVLDEQ